MSNTSLIDQGDEKPHRGLPLSTHSEVMTDVAKNMLLDCLAVGRDFCKSMIGLSTGAIPIYIGLIKFVVPSEHQLSVREALVALMPPIFFILAAVSFSFGYFPLLREFDLDHPSQINDTYTKTVERRQFYAGLGFVIFCLGLVTGVLITFFACHHWGGNTAEVGWAD